LLSSSDSPLGTLDSQCKVEPEGEGARCIRLALHLTSDSQALGLSIVVILASRRCRAASFRRSYWHRFVVSFNSRVHSPEFSLSHLFAVFRI
jgi:hypothetical protein